MTAGQLRTELNVAGLAAMVRCAWRVPGGAITHCTGTVEVILGRLAVWGDDVELSASWKPAGP